MAQVTPNIPSSPNHPSSSNPALPTTVFSINGESQHGPNPTTDQNLNLPGGIEMGSLETETERSEYVPSPNPQSLPFPEAAERIEQNVSKSGPSSPNHPSSSIPGPTSVLSINDESHHGPYPTTDQNLYRPVEIVVAGSEYADLSDYLDNIIARNLLEVEDEDTWKNSSIYWAPKAMREGDKDSFEPQMVSIGPLHHGKDMFRTMESHKWCALHRLLQRTEHHINRYIDVIKPLEKQMRSCYPPSMDMRRDEFVLCLVVDGIFVLELFRGGSSPGGFLKLGYSSHDPVFNERSIMHTLRRDMIMLENQIPLFVLGALRSTELGLPQHITEREVAELAVRFFDPLNPTVQNQTNRPQNENPSDPLYDLGLHPLDAVRCSFLRMNPESPQRTRITRTKITTYSTFLLLRRMMGSNQARTCLVVDKRRQSLIHCLSRLRKAGVSCTSGTTDKFWGITFENGVLQIPKICIHDGTKSMFLNFIAFEQCHSNREDYTITSYVIFMNNLINTEKDVRYLRKREIIEHCLGSDKEVVDLFSRLTQEVAFDFDNNYLTDLCDRVNEHSRNPCHTKKHMLRSTLKKNHFRTPWAYVSFTAAVVLLLLTFGQTYYTIYQYYVPPRPWQG